MKKLLFLLLLFIPFAVGGQIIRASGAYNKVQAAAGGYCAEYQDVYDAMTNKPTEAIADAQNVMVESLIAANVWTKFDIFYLFAQYSNTASEALINWTNPGTFNADNVSSTAWASLEGFTSDGSADYISTNWIPSSDGVNYITNSASAGIYSRSDIAEDKHDFGVNDGTGWLGLIIHWTDNQAYTWANTASGYVGGGNTNASGFYIVNRTDEMVNDLYRNKVNIIDDTSDETGVPSREVYVLCQNNNGTARLWSTKEISLFFAGGGLTQDNIDDITDAVEVYMDSNSKGVIP